MNVPVCNGHEKKENDATRVCVRAAGTAGDQKRRCAGIMPSAEFQGVIHRARESRHDTESEARFAHAHRRTLPLSSASDPIEIPDSYPSKCGRPRGIKIIIQPPLAETGKKGGSMSHSPAAPEGAERAGAAPPRLARVLAWLVLPAIVLFCRDRSSAALLQSVALIEKPRHFFSDD